MHEGFRQPQESPDESNIEDAAERAAQFVYDEREEDYIPLNEVLKKVKGEEDPPAGGEKGLEKAA